MRVPPRRHTSYLLERWIVGLRFCDFRPDTIAGIVGRPTDEVRRALRKHAKIYTGRAYEITEQTAQYLKLPDYLPRSAGPVPLWNTVDRAILDAVVDEACNWGWGRPIEPFHEPRIPLVPTVPDHTN